MTTRSAEDVRRIVLSVADMHPGAHPVMLAWVCRDKYQLQITGKQVERLLRHNSPQR